VKKPTEIILWDSCVIIDAIQKTPGRYECIEPFIRDAEKGKLSLVISEISVAEVSHLSELDKQGVSIEEQEKIIKEWLENPYIIRRQVHRGISERASEIGRKFKLKRGADRIIIATADFEKIPLIHTFDGLDPDKKNKILPLDGKIGDPPIRIMEPNPAYGTLFGTDAENKKQTQA
jgi:predicted nucleic acid-binding protein